MAGLRMGFRASPDAILGAAGTAAHVAGYRVTPKGPQEVWAQKGNFALSLLIGAFIAYCNFRLVVEALPDGVAQLTLYRNTPWWTGVIGVSRVKSKAKELADLIAKTIAASDIPYLGFSEF